MKGVVICWQQVVNTLHWVESAPFACAVTCFTNRQKAIVFIKRRKYCVLIFYNTIPARSFGQTLPANKFLRESPTLKTCTLLRSLESSPIFRQTDRRLFPVDISTFYKNLFLLPLLIFSTKLRKNQPRMSFFTVKFYIEILALVGCDPFFTLILTNRRNN